MSQPVTLEMVVALIASNHQYQVENFSNINEKIDAQNEKIDKQNEKIDKQMSEQCIKCTKSATLSAKLNSQWLAITGILLWLGAVTSYGYAMSVEFFKHIGNNTH